jgi:hypothetical protein
MPDIFVDKDTPEPEKEAETKAEVKPQEHKEHTAHAQPEHPVKQEQKTVSPAHHAIQSVDQILHGKDKPIGLFSAYIMHPKGVQFANQEPDEIVLLFLRRHFITNVPWILATIFLFLFPPILYGIITLLTSFQLPLGLMITLTGFYYLISASYAFDKFISWFYNIGVVTQKRIVDLDTTNILSHNSATANFEEIVDVKFTQQGFFQSMFDYGNIHIQTEALHANFEFDAAPKPTEVVDIISDLRVAQKGRHGDSQH